VHCFNKSQRLLKKNEFDFVFKQAKKMVTSELVLLFRTNTVGHARLGLALAKRIIPKAHDRNRVKRMVRESFRTRQLPPIDVVVLARKGVENINNSITIAKLSKAWDKLSALCEK
jgi:ribonuclease P protein component